MFIRCNTFVCGLQLFTSRLQLFTSQIIVVHFQEPRLKGFTSRNLDYRGSLPGTQIIVVHFKEPRLQGFTSRNLDYRGLLPGTQIIGVHFQEPILLSHDNKGSFLGTILVAFTSRITDRLLFNAGTYVVLFIC